MYRRLRLDTYFIQTYQYPFIILFEYRLLVAIVVVLLRENVQKGHFIFGFNKTLEWFSMGDQSHLNAIGSTYTRLKEKGDLNRLCQFAPLMESDAGPIIGCLV